MIHSKSKFLTVRLQPPVFTAFRAKAKRYGNVSDVLRELVEAFTQDRLTIRPPQTPKPLEKLYRE